MSLVTLFGGLKNVFKASICRTYQVNGQSQVKTYSTDTFVFRLHYKVTMGLMLACCLLITAIQLVTDPITCDVKVSSIFYPAEPTVIRRVCLAGFSTPFVGPMPPSPSRITQPVLTSSSLVLDPTGYSRVKRKRPSTMVSTSGSGWLFLSRLSHSMFPTSSGRPGKGRKWNVLFLESFPPSPLRTQRRSTLLRLQNISTATKDDILCMV